MPESRALEGRHLSEAVHCESGLPVNLSHHSAHNTPHSISLLLFIMAAVHPVRQLHVHADVQLIYCSEKKNTH